LWSLSTTDDTCVYSAWQCHDLSKFPLWPVYRDGLVQMPDWTSRHLMSVTHSCLWLSRWLYRFFRRAGMRYILLIFSKLDSIMIVYLR